jgi:hypothetical protein
MAQSCTRLPLLERLPQHVSKKADQNVRLDAVLFMMPDRPDAQIGFVNPKSGLGFRQLDVGFPKLFVSPVMDVVAGHLTSLHGRRYTSPSDI